jgi:hypothetical protein
MAVHDAGCNPRFPKGTTEVEDLERWFANTAGLKCLIDGMAVNLLSRRKAGATAMTTILPGSGNSCEGTRLSFTKKSCT